MSLKRETKGKLEKKSTNNSFEEFCLKPSKKREKRRKKNRVVAMGQNMVKRFFF